MADTPKVKATKCCSECQLKGGLHVHGNIAPACKPCNSAKRDKLLHVWKPDFVMPDLSLKSTESSELTNA